MVWFAFVDLSILPACVIVDPMLARLASGLVLMQMLLLSAVTLELPGRGRFELSMTWMLRLQVWVKLRLCRLRLGTFTMVLALHLVSMQLVV